MLVLGITRAAGWVNCFRCNGTRSTCSRTRYDWNRALQRTRAGECSRSFGTWGRCLGTNSRSAINGGRGVAGCASEVERESRTFAILGTALASGQNCQGYISMTFDDLAVRNMVRAGVPEKRKGSRVRAAISRRKRLHPRLRQPTERKTNAKQRCSQISEVIHGANGEGRTPIPLREPDPKSGASANSATFAGVHFHTIISLQEVTLTNTGTAAVAGPLFFILEDLPAAVTLANKSAATACFAPIGSRYLVAFPEGSSLAPDTAAVVKLAFSDPSGAAITYTPLVAGSLGGAP